VLADPAIGRFAIAVDQEVFDGVEGQAELLLVGAQEEQMGRHLAHLVGRQRFVDRAVEVEAPRFGDGREAARLAGPPGPVARPAAAPPPSFRRVALAGVHVDAAGISSNTTRPATFEKIRSGTPRWRRTYDRHFFLRCEGR
jgi:hypothetical protein